MIDETDLVTIWCFNLRRLNIKERFVVGWRMWRDGVAKYPWPVKNL